jgi:RNA polymerase sigma-70 factor, ECF subfamily
MPGCIYIVKAPCSNKLDPADTVAIHRLKAGDIAGLESLVIRYQLKATRAAFLILHDEQLAEDVVQETFVRLYHKIGSFDAARPFAPYFLKSVINTALNSARSSATWVQINEQDMEGFEQVILRAASVEELALSHALRAEIIRALAQLPPRQRAVIVQRYYLEMSEQEMADALDAPQGTIKWLLNQARTRLRGLLGQRGVGNE